MTERRPPGVPTKGRRLQDGGGGGKSVWAASVWCPGVTPEEGPARESGPASFPLLAFDRNLDFTSNNHGNHRQDDQMSGHLTPPG